MGLLVKKLHISVLDSKFKFVYPLQIPDLHHNCNSKLPHESSYRNHRSFTSMMTVARNFVL